QKRDAEYSASVAQSLQSKRTKISTKRTYHSKVNAMTAWLALHFPQTIDSITKKMLIPLPKEAILVFLIISVVLLTCVTAISLPLSASCIWGYRSALVDVCRAQLIELDHLIDTELRRVLEGYEKVINDLKKRGLMKINEGKRQLKGSGFELLALKLMKLEPVKKGQAWSTVFFVLMRNLMSRADSIDTIMLQHIEWSEDCLIVEEQGHKGDQIGAEKFGKHVYSNPYTPSQSPVLALAVLLFCCPERGKGGKQQLFLRRSFGRLLRRVIESLGEEELCILGCIQEDIGTHSLRKGSSSYALGQVSGPTPVSIYLRMGQSLGKLKDRYIHFGEGADQLCGRMIAELPFDSECFGVLPPHFPPKMISKMTIDYRNEIVSGYSSYPRGIQSAFPFLIASLIHHENYLRVTLSSSHPIFKARVFSANSLLDDQRGVTILAIGTSPVCGLKATGIPAHLAVAKQVKELRDEHFEANGVVPISLCDLDTRMSDLRSTMATEFRNLINDLQLGKSATTNNSIASEQQSEWRSWPWNDGKLDHAVPIGWEFPARANYLEQLAKETTALPAEVTRISDLQIPTADKVFDAAFSTRMSNLYATIPKRAEELSCGTLYNRLCTYRKKQQKRQHE
ncbi:hypothetical protein GN958_ATG00232, partial [Phytophthora infestans]